MFGFTKKLQNPETGTVDLLNHSFGIDDFQTVSEIAAFVACFVFLFIVYLPFTTAFDTAIDDAVESDSFTLVYDSNSIAEGSGSLPHFEYNAEWGRWLLAGNCSIDYGVKVSANGKEISVNGLQQKYQNLGSRDYSVPLISLEDGTEITVKYYDKAVEYSKPLLLILFSVMVCIFVMFFKLLSDYKVRDTDSRVGTE